MEYGCETFLSRRLRSDMYACGEAGLPTSIRCCGRDWRRQATFKHDFFACTGRYVCRETGEKIVLKMNRVQPFMGIGLRWVGRFLRDREVRVMRELREVEQTPELLCSFGECGLVYRYVPGKSLDEDPPLPHNFFFMLERLTGEIHERGVCHMDMNKRGNILLGSDGRPHVIDFQLALCLPGLIWRPIRKALQGSDFYHLLKHKRRFRADLMKPYEWAVVRRKSALIRMHRRIATPFRRVRRRVLGYLFENNILATNSGMRITPENDPRRYSRR